MADIDNLIVSMENTQIDPSGSAGYVNRLAEQLACTSMEDIDMDDGSGSDTPRPASTSEGRHNLDDDELEEDEIREESREDDSEDESDDHNNILSEGTPVTDHNDKPAKQASRPSSLDAPLDQVITTYYQHIRRLTPTTQPRLNSLLQTRAGMRNLSLYNTWLSCSAWELETYSLPNNNADLEVVWDATYRLRTSRRCKAGICRRSGARWVRWGSTCSRLRCCSRSADRSLL